MSDKNNIIKKCWWSRSCNLSLKSVRWWRFSTWSWGKLTVRHKLKASAVLIKLSQPSETISQQMDLDYGSAFTPVNKCIECSQKRWEPFPLVPINIVNCCWADRVILFWVNSLITGGTDTVQQLLDKSFVNHFYPSKSREKINPPDKHNIFTQVGPLWLH